MAVIPLAALPHLNYIRRMKPSTRQIIKAVFASDDSITEEQRRRVFEILSNRPEPSRHTEALLLSQSQVATLLGIIKMDG